MLWPIRFLTWLFTRLVMALRYRVTVVGKKELLQKPGPYLVLPNHPAFADPLVVLAHMWWRFQVRPLGLETNFQNPLLAPIGWIMRVIKVPALVTASAEERKQAEDAMKNVVASLKAGENVILWPSGRLSRDGRERMGGARATADVLAAVPEVTVVLLRTRGMWGSMFSRAQTQKDLRLVSLLLKGFGLLLASLLFFMPRRRVTLTLEAFRADTRPEPTRTAINTWLEEWYNADLKSADGSERGETPTFVPYHFLFGKRTFDFPPVPVITEVDASRIKPKTKAIIADLVAEKLKRPLSPEENQAITTFAQLGIDSLDSMEITLQVEQQFGFSSDTVPTTLGDLWALAEGQVDRGPPKPAPPAWSVPAAEPDAKLAILGETVPEAFVNRALRCRRDVAAADDRAGAVTYERMLVGARAMASRFIAFDEPNVGLLLPASVAGDTALLALHLAGKLPVVLNWTTGPANLAHAVKLMGLKRAVTSKAFIDRANIEVPGVEFVFLEEVRKTMGKLELLGLLLGGRFRSGMVRRKALRHATTDTSRPAVVLFTSGSEKAPKAVPLTHANTIANMRATLEFVELKPSDRLFGFLPLFHSFGHSVAALLPLLAGIRLVHHPDPTDASALARKIAAYRPTILCATPTFLGFIMDRATGDDLHSLRIIVVGAEKCPDAIFDRAKQLAPNAVVMEGYGITECAPIVGANPFERTKRGSIGKPLPGVEVCITEIDSHRRLPTGEMGMVHVSGPNVFPGYIGADVPQPFTEFDGKRWYITGDLGILDEDGYIFFRGRLKRFLKAGGEMISLPALEEPFVKKYPPTDAGPRVAIEGIELPGGGRKIVLFCTENLTEREANAILQSEGFRGVMRLDEVRQVPAIPVLGTGKTDYKALRTKVTEG